MTDKTVSHSTGSPIHSNRAHGYKTGTPIFIFGALLSLGIFFSMPASAKLYKWVDDKGTTHYGETIPPEYADKDRVELNKAGREVRKKEVLTPEELREERARQEEEDARKRKEEKEALEAKRHDTALIYTYSNSNEIELARKRNLQQIELRINGVKANIKIASDNLHDLQKEADTYTSVNKPIPASLQEDLKEAKIRLDKLQMDMDKAEGEKAVINARYDADKARYRELTGK